MGQIKILDVPNYDVHGRRLRGTRQLVQIVKSTNPFNPKQTVKVTATYPQEKGAILTQGKRQETVVYSGITFMEAIMKAQERFKGASISYTTLGWSGKEEASSGNA